MKGKPQGQRHGGWLSIARALVPFSHQFLHDLGSLLSLALTSAGHKRMEEGWLGTDTSPHL